MDNILRTVSSLSILVFAVSSMLSAGASFTVRQVVAPMREPDRVLRALLGNFVLVPILAVVIGRALALDSPLALGLILLGTAAGAPFLIKLVAAAEGDVALGTSLLVLLVPMTVVFMPIIVPLLAPDTSVNATAIAISLALTMLIPLAIGLVVNEVAGRAAKRLRHATRNLSTVSLVFLLVTTLLVNRYDLQVIIGSRAIIAVVLFVIGCFCIGFLIASPHPARRVGNSAAQHRRSDDRRRRGHRALGHAHAGRGRLDHRPVDLVPDRALAESPAGPRRGGSVAGAAPASTARGGDMTRKNNSPRRIGTVYPRPQHRFRDARIGMTYADSEPDYPELAKAPPASPNIVIVLLDDAGYGVASAYGGLVRAPVVEQLCQRGLQYCQFHTTALCAITTPCRRESSQRWRPAIRGTRGSSRRAARSCRRSCRTTGMRPAGGGRTTTFRRRERAPRVPSRTGRCAVASTTSTGSSAA